MGDKPRLFGADYSVYVRIARLALIEKTVDHELVPVDIFGEDGVPDWYLERHPFRRIPAFDHGAVRLFETAAITRYVDEAFDGPTLQPADAADRAVMNQIIGILDAYAYRPMVWGIYVERVAKPKNGGTTDETLVAGSVGKAATCLSSLAALKRDGPWLLGDQRTLADLHAGPMFDYFLKAPEGHALMAEHPSIGAWWDNVQLLASFEATQPSS